MDDKKKFGRKGKVYVSSVIEGPIEAVWGRTSRFADGSWMPGVSASGYLGTASHAAEAEDDSRDEIFSAIRLIGTVDL
jgi:hypothetical protein